MGYFQSNKITKLFFLLILPFFILRIPTYFGDHGNFSRFDITNIKNLILLSVDIALLFVFFFLILIQIIHFFKHRTISKSIILVIYPITGVIGYHMNGYENLYQESILFHHFITLTTIFLFFSFIQSNKLFDYKFKELCLKIILSIIFIYFLSIILPSLVVKLYLGQDLRYSYVTSVEIFANKIDLKQNINGQTKFIFILFLLVMVLFKKFYSNKKIISYLFFLIGLVLISLIYLAQSRLNILASYVFAIFIIISFKDLNLKNKLILLILIFTIPSLLASLNKNISNRFNDGYSVIVPLSTSDKDQLNLTINQQKKLVFEKFFKPDIIAVDKNEDGKPDIIAVDKNEDGKTDIWIEDKDFDGKANFKAADMDGDGILDKFVSINNSFKDIDTELDIRDRDKIFNLEIFNLEILNKDNEINYDVYLDQSLYLKEIYLEEPFFDFPNLYVLTLDKIVNYNKNIVLGECSKILVGLDSILSGRVCGWQILYNIIEKPALIFGNGFFADQIYLKPVEKVASNSFINILFNTGLVSLSIYMAVLLIFFIKYFKFKNLNHTNVYISISHYYFIYFIFRSFFEDNLAFVSVDLILLGTVSVLIKHNSQRTND